MSSSARASIRSATSSFVFDNGATGASVSDARRDNLCGDSRGGLLRAYFLQAVRIAHGDVFYRSEDIEGNYCTNYDTLVESDTERIIQSVRKGAMAHAQQDAYRRSQHDRTEDRSVGVARHQAEVTPKRLRSQKTLYSAEVKQR